MSDKGKERINRLLGLLKKVRPTHRGWLALCPAHDDRQSSLSIAEGQDGRVLLKCFAGCEVSQIVNALGLVMQDLFSDRIVSGMYPPAKHGNRATGGCTLAQYSELKHLPIEFLRTVGLTDCQYQGRAAIRIPYRNEQGEEIAVRYRIALTKTHQSDERFRWKSGAKPSLYGLWWLDAIREANSVVLVEGESDAHTLWRHGIRALGLPGAAMWREAWAEHLNGIETIYVVVEPDAGGQATRKWLASSVIRDRVKLLEFRESKDPSSLYLAAPDRFLDTWQAVQAQAVPHEDVIRQEIETRHEAAWAACKDLAHHPRILDAFVKTLPQLGVAREERASKLIYLAVTSRLLKKPVSAIVKGPSSAGKSYLVERVLEFFPADAYYALSAMSERALAYSKEPLAHRVLVLYEATALNGELGAYLVRSLLSEGCVRYETVEKTKGGIEPRLIVREGPTSLLVTTTAIKLHPENETRMLSIVISDAPDQTREILLAQAKGRTGAVDLKPWQALQTWLASHERQVCIPFAIALAQAIPPVGVRLRRDFVGLLNLISAHALLHQATRARTFDGAVIATIDDYAVVRELIADLIADGVDSSVSPQTRETVEAVRTLQGGTDKEISQVAVATYLKLDKGATSRRIRVAVERGYLKNLEERKGRPARLQFGEPLPADITVLPTPDTLEQSCCTVAQDSEGKTLHGEPDHTQIEMMQREPSYDDELGDDQTTDNTGWPIELPGLGPREHSGFERCHSCPQGTWAQYGGLPLCKRHALQALAEQGVPKPSPADCDLGLDSSPDPNLSKGESAS